MSNEYVTVTQADKPAITLLREELECRMSLSARDAWEQVGYYRAKLEELERDSEEFKTKAITQLKELLNTRTEAAANVEPDTQALLQEARGVIGEVFANRNVTKRLSWIDRAGGILAKLDAALGGA